MEDSFILNVTYNGKTEQLQSKLIRIGFNYQFHIGVLGRTLIFERDEERNFRVIDTNSQYMEIDLGFLQAVIHKLTDL